MGVTRILSVLAQLCGHNSPRCGMVNSNAFMAWRLFQLNWIPIAAMGLVVLLGGADRLAADAGLAELLLDVALVALGIRFSPSPPQRCRTLRHHPPIRQWPVSTSKAGRVAA